MLGLGDHHAGSTVKPVMEPFDYHNVTLLESRWKDQFQAGSDYYLSVSEDDILHGYRKAAGLPASGEPLGGWCRVNSDPVFGQWLSGMARIYRATGDTEMRDKAIRLLTAWEKTIGEDLNPHMDRLYSYDKLLCGLVDLYLYADVDTRPLMEGTLDWIMKQYTDKRVLETPESTSGVPGEW